MQRDASVDFYITNSIAPSTRRTYRSAVQRFRSFRDERGWLRDDPITADHAAAWFAALADRGQVQSRTIAVYKSALHTAAEQEAELGCTQPNPLDDPRVRRVIRGITRERADPERQRLRTQQAPLTFDVVCSLRAHYRLTDAREAMHYAAVTLAVATASRPSEVFGTSLLPDRAICARQIRFYADAAGSKRLEPHAGAAAAAATAPHHYEFTLEVSKTDQQRRGVVKLVSAATAVQALWTHCCALGATSDQPLFSMGGTQLSLNAVLQRARRALIASGRSELASHLGGKSFRRGGASTLSAAGISDADIARLGWARGSTVGSDVYANDPRVQRARQIAIGMSMEAAAAAARQ